MAEVSRETSSVDARIVYWGIEGSGKSANLRTVYGKLRPDHRGELRSVPTRIDPTQSYEVLPIELGEIAGVKTRIQMVAVPGGSDQAPTRKQLLDQVDGVVLVLDARRERIEENVAAYEELASALADYGRALAEVPLVVQYNRRDVADPYGLEGLHKRLDLRGVPVFEAVATEPSGVLQTLSTISKRVIRTLRDQGLTRDPETGGEPEVGTGDVDRPRPSAPRTPDDAAPDLGEAPTVVEFAPPAPPMPAPPSDLASAEPDLDEVATAVVEREPEPFFAEPEPTLVDERAPAERMEEALFAEDAHPEAAAFGDAARSVAAEFEDSWEEASGEVERTRGVRLGPDVSIVSVGEATRADDRSIRVPVVLGDAEGGTSTLVLTLRLEPLVDTEAG